MYSLITLLLSLLFGQLPAHAFKADHFKGLYEVISEQSRAAERPDKKYVVVDVDTVANIWAKYAEGELPADLQPIKDEPSILLGFTFRNGIFFNLERSALIGPDSLAMAGNGTNTMQLTRRGNGTYELGVRIDNVVTFYNLGAKQDLPSFISEMEQRPAVFPSDRLPSGPEMN